MSTTVSINTQALQELCKEFQVKELYLFGSAATGKLSDNSDLDFIVQFDRHGYEGAFDQFLDFKYRLEEIYQRPVDLYHQRTFRNAIFQEEVDRSKKLLYAA